MRIHSWENVNININPGYYSRAPILYDDCIYLFFGSQQGKQATNEILKIDLTSLSTEYIDSNAPIPRFNHTCILYQHQVVLYGGQSRTTIFKDVHIFDLKTRIWSKPNTSGRKPLRRHSHSAILRNHSMIIFGGYNSGSLNDCYELNLETFEWKCIKFVTPTPGVHGHTAVLSPNGKMIVFGGHAVKSRVNTLFEFDFSSKVCKCVEQSGNIPDPVTFHSAVVYEGDMYVFGGRNYGSRNNILYKCDLTNYHWTIVLCENSPPKRNGHSCILVSDMLYITNGTKGGEIMYSDTWRISLSSDFYIYKKLRNLNSDFCSDITISINGKDYHAHKCIISQTQSLKDLIANVRRIEVNGFEPILKYLYSGELMICDNIVQTYRLANQFQLEHLSHLCIKQMDEHYTNNFDSILKILEEGKDLSEIVELCTKKLIKFKNDILSKLKDTNDDTIATILSNALSMNDDVKYTFKPFQKLSIRDHLNSLRGDEDFYDIILVSQEGKEFKAHKIILFTFDEYFHNMFLHNWSESGQSKIVIEDVGNAALDLLLDYIYQKRIKLPDDIGILFEVHEYARKTNNFVLSTEVCNSIINKLNKTNALDIMRLCKQWQVGDVFLKKLKDKLSKFGIVDLMDIIYEQNEQIAKLQEEQLLLKKEMERTKEVNENLSKRLDLLERNFNTLNRKRKREES